MKQQNQIHAEEQLEQLQNYTSSGTTLISYYIHHNTNHQNALRKIQEEQAQAKNIKSKQTRKDVSKALSLIQTELQQTKTIPDTGLIIFAGNPSETDPVSTTIIPPTKLNTSQYICQNTFYTEPLEQLYTPSTQYGCILLDTNNALIATITGTTITVHNTLTSLVPGKHSKGGQSQQRFERRRTEHLHNFYKDIATASKQFITTDSDLNGLLIGGPQHTRTEFIRNNYLHHTHQDQILYKDSVSTINKNGVQELLRKAEDTLQNAQITKENTLITKFMKQLRNQTAVYGVENTKKAARYGAIDTLLLSKNTVKQTDDTTTVKNLVEEYNGTITYLECNSEKGGQFESVFTGIGAILRYPIN